MASDGSLRLDHSAAWDRAVAAALDYLLARRGDRVRASEIWAAICQRERFRILVATADGKEVDATDDRAIQIAEVRFLMTGLHRRARLVEAGGPPGDATDPEYLVVR